MLRHWDFPLGPASGIVIAISVVAPACANAEAGYVMVQVTDMNHRPLAGIMVEIEGYGGTSTTGTDGKARIPVSNSAQPGDSITFSLINPTKGRQLAIFSPWDRRSNIPRFEDKPENYISIMVITLGERQALENRGFLRAATLKISDANARQAASVQNQSVSPRYITDASGNAQLAGAEIERERAQQKGKLASLNWVAEEYGFAPHELDQAIRNWGDASKSEFDAGIVSYYERDFVTASRKLSVALKMAEEESAFSHYAANNKEQEIAESAFFLGSSLFELGHYQDSANAYKEYLKVKPNDPYVLDCVARSYQESEDYSKAKEYSDLAESIARKIYNPDDPGLASVLDSSALTALLGGDALRAEKLLYEAIAIDRRSGSNVSHNLAATYNNLGIALQNQGRYSEAETAYRDAISIDDQLLGPDNLESARYQNNLAMLWSQRGQYNKAEQEFQSLLSLREKQQGPNHPQVAATLSNLARTLVGHEITDETRGAVGDQGRFDEARSYALRALSIDRQNFGTNSRRVAADLFAVAEIDFLTKQYEDARDKLQDALAIYKILDEVNSLDYGRTLTKLADASWRLGKLSQAEAQSREALRILQERLAPTDPFLALSWEQAGYIYSTESKFREAADAFRKAFTVANAGLGPRHHITQRIQRELKAAEAGQRPTKDDMG